MVRLATAVPCLVLTTFLFCACNDGSVGPETDAGPDAQDDHDGDAGELPDDDFQDADAGDEPVDADDGDSPADQSDPGPVECNDGIDNDGDGLTDWQLDLGCYGPADPTEGGLNNQLDKGWTVFERAADTTVIYVSSSAGDDSYTGLAPDFDGVDGPKQTIAGGVALMQDGRPDWLLFRRGDVWVDETLGNWKISGRSATEPVILGSYGDSTERPRFEVAESWLTCHSGGGASAHRSHLRILGIHVKMVSKDPNHPRFTARGGSCLQWLRDGGDLLIEDVWCEYAQLNLQSDPILPFAVRRSLFSGSYSVNSHAQSMFTSIGVDLILEDNLFYHGGWNDDFRLALWAPEGDPAVWEQHFEGRFGIDLNGNHYDIDSVDFSGVTSMQEVAAILESRINQAAGAGTAQLFFTQGGAFQLRSDTLPSGANYAITPYGGPASGSDLDALFNLGAQGCPESTIFNRNLYLSYGKGHTVMRGNLDIDGASGGVQIRMGGVCEDNLFINDPIAVTYGHRENPADNYVGGSIKNNVILGARDIDTQVQGTGIIVSSYATTSTGGYSLVKDLEISGNIILKNVLGTGNIKGIALAGDGVFENVEIHDNLIYDWARPNWPDPMDQRAHGMNFSCPQPSVNVAVHHNILQQPNGGFLMASGNSAAGVSLDSNAYWSAAPDPPDIWSRGWFSLGGSVSMSEWLSATGETNASSAQVQFVDSSRSLESYLSSLSLEPTLEVFVGEALMQSKYHWREELTAPAINAWIREGFQPAK